MNWCKIFQRNFRKLLAFAVPKDTMPPNFTEETFVNSHETAKFVKVFSLESFPLYSILIDLSNEITAAKAFLVTLQQLNLSPQRLCIAVDYCSRQLFLLMHTTVQLVS